MNRFGLALSASIVVSLVSSVSHGAVRKEGVWPDAEKGVSFSAQGEPRSLALRKLADAAGWSLVVQTPPSGEVDMTLRDEAPAKVLELLLRDADYVAKRDGNLVELLRDVPSGPSDAGLSPRKEKPADRGRDRSVFGQNLRVEAREVLRDVAVFGGNVEVFGTITGDLEVTGGNITVHPGGHVFGDVAAIGGNVSLEEGAEIDGDITTTGGELKRAASAIVRGDVTSNAHQPSFFGSSREPQVGFFSMGARMLGSIVTKAAFLFVLGAVLFALIGDRMDKLRAEAVARPMRSFALGIVGSIAAALLGIALCITILGIPIAALAALLGVFAVYGSLSAVLTVFGEALFRHKTQNPYVHLALGSILFAVVSQIPYVGGAVTAVAVFVAIGVLVATRCAGYFPKRRAGVTA